MTTRTSLPIGFILSALAGGLWAGPNDKAELDPVVVSASPLTGVESESFQSVSVITRAEIEASPARTLAGLLATVGGVDVRRRGGPGVQADAGIRGTAYEQTLILLNGIPLSDPQTGHHNMNLPVPLEHIERIEIVKGPGGITYGGAATGGLINIITREAEQTELGMDVRAGNLSTRQAGIHGGIRTGGHNHLASAEWHVSDGHLPEDRADSDLRRFNYTGGARLGRGTLNWGLGAGEKEFGAWKFYTADFPDQREETSSRLAWIAGQFETGGWELTPRVYWRAHEDWFRTLVGETAYINEHETDVAGFRLGAQTALGRGTAAVGVSGERQRIDSNALDEHRRDEVTVWTAHRQPLGERAVIEASLGLVDYSDYGSELLPAVGLRYRLAEHWTGFASTARSARIPSYTEQFLVTGGNRGNPGLSPERSHLHEAGLRFAATGHRVSAALFERRTRDLIDWARAPGETQWRADNFDGHRTRGGEVAWRWAGTGRVNRVRLAWTVLDTRLDDQGLEIKYALDFARQAWSGSAGFDLGAGFDLSVQARHLRRHNGERVTLAGLRLARSFEHAQVYLEGENLLDREVIEAGFAPLPGRLVRAGVRLEL